jgi:predicted permease
MSVFAYLRSLSTRFLHRSQIDADMEEELRSHIEHRADDLERSGLDRAEAERRARIEFGGHERYREECNDEIGGNFLEVLAQDVRFSVRVLRKSPGFTLVAVLTLALAIGANAVVFGVMDGLIIRPLNVPRAESLYGIEHGNEHSMELSYPDYLDLRDRNRSFESLAAFEIDLVGMDAGDSPSRAWINVVSGNYFDVLGIQPYLGRTFHGSDEHGPNSAPYIVLSHAYWQSRFQSDPAVIGRTVRVNKNPFTIIGVAPAGFYGTLVFFSPDFFAPMINQQQLEGTNQLDARGHDSVFMSMGHLKPGVTPAQAVDDLNAIGAYLEKTYPKQHGRTTFKLARPGLYGNFLGSPVRAFLAALMLLAGLILLASCANLGTLFAARAADRAHEVALRLALGAGHGRIVRQLLTEALLVSIAGGALGLWASLALLSAMDAWHPVPEFPINIPVSPDGNVYVMASVLALISALLFGIGPVRQALRADPYQVIKAGTSGPAPRRITVRDLLLAAQIAICAVLVTSSTVAVRGLARSLNSNFGFDPRNVVLADTDLVMARYTGDEIPAVQKRMITAVEAIPGVQSVGMVNRLPLHAGGFGSLIYTDTTTDLRASNAAANAFRFNVSPEYFDAARSALLAGRPFSWHDDREAPRVAVVNRTFAWRIFGSTASAVGAHFKLRDGSRVQVVGVVEDGKYMSLAEDPEAALYVPLLQAPASETWLIVRSARDPDQLAEAIRTALRGVDRAMPVHLQTWTRQLDFALFPSRIATVSLGVMGVMGAALAITGIFGMAAYSVSKRMKELGIRVALGAKRKEVLAAALGRAVRLLAFGSAAGLLLGLLASRVLASIVYQASPRDPVVLVCVVALMSLLGLVATWIPARRALLLDPLTLLREE